MYGVQCSLTVDLVDVCLILYGPVFYSCFARLILLSVRPFHIFFVSSVQLCTLFIMTTLRNIQMLNFFNIIFIVFYSYIVRKQFICYVFQSYNSVMCFQT